MYLITARAFSGIVHASPSATNSSIIIPVVLAWYPKTFSWQSWTTYEDWLSVLNASMGRSVQHPSTAVHPTHPTKVYQKSPHFLPTCVNAVHLSGTSPSGYLQYLELWREAKNWARSLIRFKSSKYVVVKDVTPNFYSTFAMECHAVVHTFTGLPVHGSKWAILTKRLREKRSTWNREKVRLRNSGIVSQLEPRLDFASKHKAKLSKTESSVKKRIRTRLDWTNNCSVPYAVSQSHLRFPVCSFTKTRETSWSTGKDLRLDDFIGESVYFTSLF